MLKVISTGKGGVGKTTTISTLATMFSRGGKRVLVFDTDPSMNLAMTLGIPYMETPTITGEKEHINHALDESDEDTHIVIGDILRDQTVRNKDGVDVLVMGAIPEDRNGCLCSAVSIIKMIVSYLDSDDCSDRYDVLLVDSQAGPEILGRGMAKDFDYNLILTEPTPKSAEVSRQVVMLANNLGMKNNILLINKSESEEDLKRISELVGVPERDTIRIRFDHHVIEADRENECLLDSFPRCDAVSDIRRVKDRLEIYL